MRRRARSRSSTPAFLTIVNAIENASRTPVTPDGIVSMLRDGRGHPSQLRTMFSDVSLQTLESVAASAGLDLQIVLRSYCTAKKTAAAANAELDRILNEPW